MTVGRPADVFHTNDAHGVPGVLIHEHSLAVVSADAPVLTNARTAGELAHSTLAYVDTDTGNGTLYWVVTQSATEPSIARIQAGQDHTGADADDSGSQAVTETGDQAIQPSGLEEETTYYLYFQQEDSNGNDSNIASTSFTTTEDIGRPFDLRHSHSIDEMPVVSLTGDPKDVLHRNNAATGDPEDVLHRNMKEGGPSGLRHSHSIAEIVFGEPARLRHQHKLAVVSYVDAEGWPENLWHAHGPSSTVTVSNAVGDPADISHGHTLEEMPVVLPDRSFSMNAQAQDATGSFTLLGIVGVTLKAKAQDAIASFTLHVPAGMTLAAQAQDASASFSLFRYNNICWDEKDGADVTMEEHRQETTPDWKKC